MRTVFLSALLLAVVLLASNVSASVECLLPDSELSRQEFVPGDDLIYRLCSLEPNKNYEVRVSYPSTHPTIFKFHLTSNPEYVAPDAGRSLMNAEKIMFRTDASSVPSNSPCSDAQSCFVKISTSQEAPSYRENSEHPTFMYNIVLETLSVSNIPKLLYRLLPVVVILLVIVGFMALPWITCYLGVGNGAPRKKSRKRKSNKKAREQQ